MRVLQAALFPLQHTTCKINGNPATVSSRSLYQAARYYCIHFTAGIALNLLCIAAISCISPHNTMYQRTLIHLLVLSSVSIAFAAEQFPLAGQILLPGAMHNVQLYPIHPQQLYPIHPHTPPPHTPPPHRGCTGRVCIPAAVGASQHWTPSVDLYQA